MMDTDLLEALAQVEAKLAQYGVQMDEAQKAAARAIFLTGKEVGARTTLRASYVSAIPEQDNCGVVFPV